MNEIPEFLYKYISIKTDKKFRYFLSFLEQNELHLSQPDNFYDPYDCATGINFENETPESLKNIIPTDGDGQEKKNITDKNISNFIKDKDKHDTVNQDIRNTSKTLNDKLGIYCLTENDYNYLPMWAYYGDNHKGLVIKFNTKFGIINELNTQKVPIYKVTYDESFPKWSDLNDKLGHEYINVLSTRKSIYWSQEKEWRIIAPQEYYTNSKIKYHNTILNSIYFGAEIEKRKKNKIISTVKNKIGFDHVKLFDLKEDHSSFNLIPILI
jgi:hypothetical protein